MTKRSKKYLEKKSRFSIKNLREVFSQLFFDDFIFGRSVSHIDKKGNIKRLHPFTDLSSLEGNHGEWDFINRLDKTKSLGPDENGMYTWKVPTGSFPYIIGIDPITSKEEHDGTK